MATSDINFHQSFKPEMDYIAKIMEIANCGYAEISKDEISEMTGIPTGKSSGKVEPHIDYASFMNLIEYKKISKGYNMKLTEMGELIYNEDPFFLEELSRILCNYFLTSNISGAPIWNDITRNIRHKYGNSVKESVVKKELDDKYSKNIKISQFNSTYESDSSLGGIEFMNLEDSNGLRNIIFSDIKPKSEYIYMYGYTLIKELENEIFGNRKEFTEEEIFNGICWNNGLGMTYDNGIKVLEELNDIGVIKLNKQLSPMTIILNTHSDELIESIYSLL